MPCLSVLEQWGALETCTSRSRGEATSSPWCFLPILLVSWAAATCRLVHRDRADDAGARYRADPLVLTHRITTPRSAHGFAAFPHALVGPRPRNFTSRRLEALRARFVFACGAPGAGRATIPKKTCAVSATSERYHGREVRRNKGSRRSQHRLGETDTSSRRNDLDKPLRTQAFSSSPEAKKRKTKGTA